MDDLIRRYSEELQKVQRERNELKQQLAEKDKEIEELKEQSEIWQKLLFEKMETQIVGVTNEKLKEIRHQVCEEIKQAFENRYNEISLNGVFSRYDTLWCINRIIALIDQIE